MSECALKRASRIYTGLHNNNNNNNNKVYTAVGNPTELIKL